MNVFCILLLFSFGFNQGVKIRVRKRWYLPQTQSSRQTTQERNYHIPYYLYGQGHNQTFYTTNRDPNLVYFNRKPLHWATRINNDKSKTKYDIEEHGNSDVYSSAYIPLNKDNDNSMYKNEIDRQLLQYRYINDDPKPQQKQYLAYGGQLQSKDFKETSSKDKIEANLSAKTNVNSPPSYYSFNDVNISDTVAQSQLTNLKSMNETDEVTITSTENEKNENLDAGGGINAKHRKIKIIVSQIPAEYIVTSYKNDEAVDSVKISEKNNDPLSILTDNKQESSADSRFSLLENTRRRNNNFGYENSDKEVYDIDNLLSYYMSQNKPVIANENWYRDYLGTPKTNYEENTLPNNYPTYPDTENIESIKDSSIDQGKVNLENKQMEDEIIQLADLILKTNYITNPYNGYDGKGYAIYPAPSSSFGNYEFKDIGNPYQLVNFEPIKKVDEVTNNSDENYENLLTIKENDANHKKDNKIVSAKPTKNLVIENSVDDNKGIKSDGNSLNTVHHSKKIMETDNVDKNSMNSAKDIIPSSDPVPKNMIASQKDMNIDPIDQISPIMAQPYSYRDILYLLNKRKQNEENNIFIKRNNEVIRLLPINYQIYPESNNFWRIYGYPEDRPKSHWENEWMKQKETESNNPPDVPSKINIDNKRYTGDEQENPLDVVTSKINIVNKHYRGDEKANTAPCAKRPGHRNKRPQKMSEIEEMDTIISRLIHPKIRKRFTIRLIKLIGESDLPLQAKNEMLVRALDESQKTNLQYNTLNDKETSIGEVSNIYEYNKDMPRDDQMAPTYNVRYVKSQHSQQKVPEKQIPKINEMEQSFDDPDYDTLEALINENIGKIMSSLRQKETGLQTETGPQQTSKSEEYIHFRPLKSKVTHQLFDNPEDELEIKTSSPLISYNYEREPTPKLTSKFGTFTTENAKSSIESAKIQQNEDIVKSQSDFNTTEEILKSEDVPDKNSKKNTEKSMKLSDSPIIYISMSPDSNMSRGKKSAAFRDYFNVSQQAPKENAANTENATNAPDASKMALSDHGKNTTEQSLKEYNKTEIIAANNTGLDNWTEILINALFSEALPTADASGSKKSSQKANESFISNNMTNSSEQIKESDEIIRKQHLKQILDIMAPDLLKLYNTCHTQSNEELLKEWKILIESTLKKCERIPKL